MAFGQPFWFATIPGRCPRLRCCMAFGQPCRFATFPWGGPNHSGSQPHTWGVAPGYDAVWPSANHADSQLSLGAAPTILVRNPIPGALPQATMMHGLRPAMPIRNLPTGAANHAASQPHTWGVAPGYDDVWPSANHADSQPSHGGGQPCGFAPPSPGALPQATVTYGLRPTRLGGFRGCDVAPAKSARRSQQVPPTARYMASESRPRFPESIPGFLFRITVKVPPLYHR